MMVYEVFLASVTTDGNRLGSRTLLLEATNWSDLLSQISEQSTPTEQPTRVVLLGALKRRKKVK